MADCPSLAAEIAREVIARDSSLIHEGLTESLPS